MQEDEQLKESRRKKKKKKKVGEKTKNVGFLNSYGISYKHFTTKSNILPIPGLRY